MKKIWKQHWFLISLGVVLLVGITFPRECQATAQAIPKNWVIAIVLMLMALPLRIDAMWNTVRRPGPAFLAVAINSLMIPLLSWPLSHLLEGELAIGLVVAASVPCTIASATVWTRLAGGNEAVSMMVTVITNLACFLVTPAWVWAIVGKSSETDSFTTMASKLLLIVVLPIVVAQLLRLIPGVASFASEKKPLLNIVAQAGLLSIVFLGAVHSGLQLEAISGHMASVAGQIVLMLFLVAAIHLVAWFGGLLAGRARGYSEADALAVAFAGSQKTLMVGLAIALDFGGLAILPMLAYHVEQLLIDTVLAERYRTSEPRAEPEPDRQAAESSDGRAL